MNLRSAFAKKITGVVVAADGTICTVDTSYQGINLIGTKSKPDEKWKAYTAYRTRSEYWKVCKYNSNIEWYSWGVYSLDISYCGTSRKK